jgi:hypothetical protein
MSDELPPLTILTHEDGSPDWPAINALARKTILDVLRGADEPMSGRKLEEACRQRGIYEKVTYRARRELAEEGQITNEERVVRGPTRSWRAKLWRVRVPGDEAARQTPLPARADG